MSSKIRKVSTQNVNLIISCLVSGIIFVFLALFAKGLSGIGNTAVLESLFYYCKDTQILTLFGEAFPVSDFVLKLVSFPSASIAFTLEYFPPLMRNFIYTFADTFCDSLGNFISFIIEFMTR